MNNGGKIPEELVRQIVKGEVVLFIGDELAGNHGKEKGFPTYIELMGKLMELCDYPNDELQSLPIVASYFEVLFGRHALLKLLIDSYSDTSVSPNRAYLLAARLPCSPIITTNVSRMLERAFERPPVQPYFCVIGDTDVPYQDSGKKMVVKLFGSVEDPESLIITDQDHSKLLHGLPALNLVIRSHLATKTWLFIGHNIQSEFFRQFYDNIVTRAVDRHRRRSYAILKDPSPVVAAIWARRELTTIARDPTDFLEDLVLAISSYQEKDTHTDKNLILPDSPFKFLDYFERTDTQIFFGRDAEAAHLARQVETHKLTVLVGQSGVGKTSLLNAGVTPKLEDSGYQVVYIRALSDPAEIIKRSLWAIVEGRRLPLSSQASLMSLRRFLEGILPEGARTVFLIDQFEEFFMRLGEASREDFAATIVDCMKCETQDLRFVLSLREDYLYRLLEMEPPVRGIFSNRFWLRNLDESRARDAMVEPVKPFGLNFEDRLVRVLLRDLESGGIDPSQLQIVCYRLYQSIGNEKAFTFDSYMELGGTGKILATYLSEVMDTFDSREYKAAQAILKSMVTVEGTKAALSVKEVTRDAIVRKLKMVEEEVTSILKILQNKRIIRRLSEEEDLYELAHEVMVERVWEWIDAEDITYKYVRQMLRQALADWKQLRVLPSSERWNLLNKHRKELILTKDEAVLMLHASLNLGVEMDYWLTQANTSDVNIWEEIGIIMKEGKPIARHNVLRWVEENKGSHELSIYKMALESKYPALWRQAQRILLKMNSHDSASLLESFPKQPSEILIPKGWFVMGTNEGRYQDEEPAHKVLLDAFYIHRYPVTNIEYKSFLDATGHPSPDYWTANHPPEGKEDHPVVGVSWHDANSYCEWFSKQTSLSYRLPTEAEWEKAASWDEEFQKKYKWAWGNIYDPQKGNTRIGGPGDTTPIGQYSNEGGDSPYGVSDMSGNTFDWTLDWWSENYYSESPSNNPKGPESGVYKVSRGGSWAGSSEGACTVSRYYAMRPEVKNEYIGFRLARNYDKME